MDGILLINKPKGWSSFDVVAKVRGIIRRETGIKKPKVGHTGTLDPLATGLLVLVVGSYTKRAPELTKANKTYEVTMKLGEVSTTGDAEGEITLVSESVPDKETVLSALQAFVGDIEQVPPSFSAVKVNGQRAYKLARAGKEVKIEPRKVKIYDITNIEYVYPNVKFTAKVSSGTYIRTLVEDIGKQIKTGAYMSDLCRTHVGVFDLSKAQSIESVAKEGLKVRSL